MRFMANARPRTLTQCGRSGHRDDFRSGVTALQLLPHDLDSGGKEIAGAALGFYERRLSVVGLDLLAQPSYLHVDRAIVDLVVVQPGPAGQLVCAQEPAGPGQAGERSVEF